MSPDDHHIRPPTSCLVRSSVATPAVTFEAPLTATFSLEPYLAEFCRQCVAHHLVCLLKFGGSGTPTVCVPPPRGTLKLGDQHRAAPKSSTGRLHHRPGRPASFGTQAMHRTPPPPLVVIAGCNRQTTTDGHLIIVAPAFFSSSVREQTRRARDVAPCSQH